MNRMSWREVLTHLGVAAAVMIGAAQATAAPVVSVHIMAGDDPGNAYENYSASSDPNLPSGPFEFAGTGYGTSFACDWTIAINPDPQITSTFSLTNLSAATQTFIMTITLPIAALGPATVQGGYFGADASALVPGTRYTDTSGNSDVTLSTVGLNPFYQALVNGIASQNLGSFTVNANGGAGVYGEIAQQAWGTPIPSAPFGPASGNIQIRWQFSLTGGDKVETKGFFQVEQAPEPATVALIGLGLAALVVARRRA